MLKSKLVYKAQHQVSDMNMEIEVEESYDRNRWMTVKAVQVMRDGSTTGMRCQEFSEQELCGRLGVKPDELPRLVGKMLSYRLFVSKAGTLSIGADGQCSSPSTTSPIVRSTHTARAGPHARCATDTHIVQHITPASPSSVSHTCGGDDATRGMRRADTRTKDDDDDGDLDLVIVTPPTHHGHA